MTEFIRFIKDGIIDISSMLNDFEINISGMEVSLFELFLGFVALSIVISVFWKGARG